LARQGVEGYWSAELIGDVTLEADAVMLMHFLGDVDAVRQRRLLRHVLSQQNDDGGWPIFHGGPSDPNATVKAYFALRLAGFPDDDEPVRRARSRIEAFGGIEVCNSYTKFYLAIFGQYDWDRLPAMIPEIMLLPKSSRIPNLYRISAWTRTIVVPMLIIYALRPSVSIPFSLRDLIRPLKRPRARSRKQAFWHASFRGLDRAMRFYNRAPLRRTRRRALESARRWMLERIRPAGGLGAIYPPMLNAIIALRALGYRDDSPELSKALREFRDLEVEDGELMRVQPCFSVVWDTAWAVHALARSGCPDEGAVRRGAEWLLSKQIFTGGDWQVNNRAGRPAAWAFEHDNPVYPDTDDTAAVLLGLLFAGCKEDRGFASAVAWLRSMQNPDGGWGAFDRNVDLKILEYLPWADHNALLDPSTADLTGRILQLFGHLGHGREEPFARRAIRFLRAAQEPDGPWFGRWGVNYVHGTWQVLIGLRAIGEDMSAPWVRKAADWLTSVQNLDGGWGESCRSYADPGTRGRGPSTPSQTAWGLLGLLAARRRVSDPAVRRGLDFLLRAQRPDGGWEEREHTGTGFPRVFYLVYTMYRNYFPLLALQAVRDGLEPRAPLMRRASL
ncbi:MAG TPA: squalene--hopene cyclase, partial [Candidatus Polarisedimenticolia bacterium]